MVTLTHRAKGLALMVAVGAVGGLVVAENPEAVGVGLFGLLLLGVLAMLVGLAWLFLTVARED